MYSAIWEELQWEVKLAHDSMGERGHHSLKTNVLHTQRFMCTDWMLIITIILRHYSVLNQWSLEDGGNFDS